MSDKLKPSQLLRLGASKVKQCRLRTFVGHEGVVVEACAYGMMVIGKLGSLNFDECRSASLVEEDTIGKEGLKQLNEIVKKNDRECQTPEQIAQWLESKGL